MSPASVRQRVCPFLIPHAEKREVNHPRFLDRLITAKDHASVQISIVDVDSNGRALGTSTTFALCGQVRSQGESDDSVNRLATKAGREYSLVSSTFLVFNLIYFASPPQCLVVLQINVLYSLFLVESFHLNVFPGLKS